MITDTKHWRLSESGMGVINCHSREAVAMTSPKLPEAQRHEVARLLLAAPAMVALIREIHASVSEGNDHPIRCTCNRCKARFRLSEILALVPEVGE